MNALAKMGHYLLFRHPVQDNDFALTQVKLGIPFVYQIGYNLISYDASFVCFMEKSRFG